jgi:hypothetical protein
MKFSFRKITGNSLLGTAIERTDSAAERPTGLLKQACLAEGFGSFHAGHPHVLQRFPLDVV